MNNLRNDWVKLDKAYELIEDGPIDYLSDRDVEILIGILDKMRYGIRDMLSIKELGNFNRNDII